ncbi:MAG TPA: PDZ domain-containing protein, partial [Geminicoccaceae bacterium]|nr:PDZ domain-containing protein [Geminicoccaceae bacterium]
SEVQSGSPAEKAGLKQGDVVLSFDGQEIDRVGALSRAVAAVDPGKTAELVVWRDGKEQRIQAEIGLMPTPERVASTESGVEDTDQPRLGLALANLTPELREQMGVDADVDGVLVTQVVPGGPADAKGMQPGDVILSVDREKVSEPSDVVAAIRKAHEEGVKSVLLYVSRDGTERFEAVPLATS